MRVICLGPLLHHGEKLERRAPTHFRTPVPLQSAETNGTTAHFLAILFRLLNVPRSHTPNPPPITSPFPKHRPHSLPPKKQVFTHHLQQPSPPSETKTAATMMPRLATTLLLAATATAHFNINNPPQKKPSDESELEYGPCGGANLDFKDDDISDFHIDGDAIAVTGTHPESNWLLRATTDKTGEGNWTQIFPVVKQSGLGKMCQPVVTVPEDWEGEEGLIGVVANAEDGILFGVSLKHPLSLRTLPFCDAPHCHQLITGHAQDTALTTFQCSQVRFVSGTADPPSDCKNTTSQISYTSDSDLEALLGDNSGESGPSADDDSNSDSDSDSDDGDDDDSAGAGFRAGLFGVGFAVVAALVL